MMNMTISQKIIGEGEGGSYLVVIFTDLQLQGTIKQGCFQILVGIQNVSI